MQAWTIAWLYEDRKWSFDCIESIHGKDSLQGVDYGSSQLIFDTKSEVDNSKGEHEHESLVLLRWDQWAVLPT